MKIAISPVPLLATLGFSEMSFWNRLWEHFPGRIYGRVTNILHSRHSLLPAHSRMIVIAVCSISGAKLSPNCLPACLPSSLTPADWLIKNEADNFLFHLGTRICYVRLESAISAAAAGNSKSGSLGLLLENFLFHKPYNKSG